MDPASFQPTSGGNETINESIQTKAIIIFALLEVIMDL